MRAVSRIRGERTEFAAFASRRATVETRLFAARSDEFEAKDRTTENRGVGGSSPGLAIRGPPAIRRFSCRPAVVGADRAERDFWPDSPEDVEELRIVYVPLTGAQRYCALALPADTETVGRRRLRGRRLRARTDGHRVGAERRLAEHLARDPASHITEAE